MGPLLLLHPEQEEGPRPGGGASSSASSPGPSLASSLTPSSSSSPPPFYSPSPSPPPTPLLLLDKAGQLPESDDMLSFSWLAQPDQLGRAASSQAAGTDDNDKEAAFCDLDWMTERMDLSEFDLDTLIGPCSPHDDSPSSPEGLLDSLDCPMDLDSLPLPTLAAAATPALDLAPPSVPSSPRTPATETPPACLSVLESVSLLDAREHSPPLYSVPDPQDELEIKSEPVSPAPSSSTSPSPVHSPPSPAYTLDLGSEVDVAECEVKPIVATIVPQVPRIVLSLSPTRIVLVLAPKSETGISATTTTATPTTTVATRQEVVYSSPPAPTPLKSHRSRPYPDPKSRLSPPSPSPSTSSVRVKCPRGTAAMKEERVASRPVKEKKLKKMEQNKTAATRYRQKKRAENEMLSVEYAELEKKNIELTEKAESMAREIQYLKELMDEVRLTRIKKGLCADL